MPEDCTSNRVCVLNPIGWRFGANRGMVRIPIGRHLYRRESSPPTVVANRFVSDAQVAAGVIGMVMLWASAI